MYKKWNHIYAFAVTGLRSCHLLLFPHLRPS